MTSHNKWLKTKENKGKLRVRVAAIESRWLYDNPDRFIPRIEFLQAHKRLKLI